MKPKLIDGFDTTDGTVGIIYADQASDLGGAEYAGVEKSNLSNGSIAYDKVLNTYVFNGENWVKDDGTTIPNSSGSAYLLMSDYDPSALLDYDSTYHYYYSNNDFGVAEYDVLTFIIDGEAYTVEGRTAEADGETYKEYGGTWNGDTPDFSEYPFIYGLNMLVLQNEATSISITTPEAVTEGETIFDDDVTFIEDEDGNIVSLNDPIAFEKGKYIAIIDGESRVSCDTYIDGEDAYATFGYTLMYRSAPSTVLISNELLGSVHLTIMELN